MNYSMIYHADGPTAYFYLVGNFVLAGEECEAFFEVPLAALFYAGKVGTALKSGGGGFPFTWNWINLFGLLIIALLLLPNIIYAIKHKDGRNLCENRCMNVIEQTGRYGSMLFMIFCLREGGYGFSSVALFLVYFFGNALLLVVYWVVWGIYFHVTRTEVTGCVKGVTSFLPYRKFRPGRGRMRSILRIASQRQFFIAGKHRSESVGILKMSLAVIPSCLFLLSGITLGYFPLIVSAILFAVGHIYVTYKNVNPTEM